jgi:predicted nucleotidyltransferase
MLRRGPESAEGETDLTPRHKTRPNQGAVLPRREIVRRLRALLSETNIQRFILFGSFARGTQTADSDVDLIVIVRTEKRFLDRYNDWLLPLHRTLRPHAVSPLIYTEEEFEMLRQRPFGIVKTACKEGMEISV